MIPVTEVEGIARSPEGVSVSMGSWKELEDDTYEAIEKPIYGVRTFSRALRGRFPFAAGKPSLRRDLARGCTKQSFVKNCPFHEDHPLWRTALARLRIVYVLLLYFLFFRGV